MADTFLIDKLRKQFIAQGYSPEEAQAQAELAAKDTSSESLSPPLGSEESSSSPNFLQKIKGVFSAGALGAQAQAYKKPPMSAPAAPAIPKIPEQPKKDSVVPKSEAKSETAGPSLSKQAQSITVPSKFADVTAEIEKHRAMMPEDKRAEFDAEYKKLDSARKEMIQLYKEDKKALDWGRVGEMLGRSMVLLAAGMAGQGAAGMKGVAESEKWDWKTDYDALKSALDMELEGNKAKRASTEKSEERLMKELGEVAQSKRQEVGRRADDERKAKITQAEINARLATQKAEKPDSTIIKLQADVLNDREKAIDAALSKFSADKDKAKDTVLLKNATDALGQAGLRSEEVGAYAKAWGLGKTAIPVKNVQDALLDAKARIAAQRNALVGLPAAGEPNKEPASGVILRKGPDGKTYKFDAVTKKNLGLAQ